MTCLNNSAPYNLKIVSIITLNLFVLRILPMSKERKSLLYGGHCFMDRKIDRGRRNEATNGKIVYYFNMSQSNLLQIAWQKQVFSLVPKYEQGRGSESMEQGPEYWKNADKQSGKAKSTGKTDIFVGYIELSRWK